MVIVRDCPVKHKIPSRLQVVGDAAPFVGHLQHDALNVLLGLCYFLLQQLLEPLRGNAVLRERRVFWRRLRDRRRRCILFRVMQRQGLRSERLLRLRHHHFGSQCGRCARRLQPNHSLRPHLVGLAITSNELDRLGAGVLQELCLRYIQELPGGRLVYLASFRNTRPQQGIHTSVVAILGFPITRERCRRSVAPESYEAVRLLHMESPHHEATRHLRALEDTFHGFHLGEALARMDDGTSARRQRHAPLLRLLSLFRTARPVWCLHLLLDAFGHCVKHVRHLPHGARQKREPAVHMIAPTRHGGTVADHV
mmetsp:Transcript_82457/g.229827  ORF Transcript_82457/g.229827 Transcript_82457/m.229827 type:complete len:310 (-) Transcript_82457:949-1878(-)